MSLLEQNITRKGQVDKEVKQVEFDNGDNEEYEIEAIQNSAVYVRESESGHLLGLYYLISWKKYLEEENIGELALAVQYLKKLFSLFHKDYPDKPIVTFLTINTTSPMVRPTVKSKKLSKWKQRWLANNTNKRAKKN